MCHMFMLLLLLVAPCGRGLRSLHGSYHRPYLPPLMAFLGDGEFVDRISLANWAVFETMVLDLEGRPGFVAITGETGSGKSMIIKALEYCAGTGKKKAPALHLFSSSSSNDVGEESTRIDIMMKPRGLVTNTGKTVGIRSDRLYSRVSTRAPKKSYVEIDGKKSTG